MGCWHWRATKGISDQGGALSGQSSFREAPWELFPRQTKSETAGERRALMLTETCPP